jgi:hypothetical protein
MADKSINTINSIEQTKAGNFVPINVEEIKKFKGSMLNIDTYIDDLIQVDESLNGIFESLLTFDPTLSEEAVPLAESLLNLQKNIITLTQKRITETIENTKEVVDDEAKKKLEEYKKKVKELLKQLTEKTNQLDRLVTHKKNNPVEETSVKQGETITATKALDTDTSDFEQQEKEIINNITNTINTLKKSLSTALPNFSELGSKSSIIIPPGVIIQPSQQSTEVGTAPETELDGGYQIGGNINNLSREFKDLLLIGKKIFNVFNTDMMLKIMTYINYPEQFVVIKNWNGIFDKVFINVTDFSNLNFLLNGTKRDTYIANRYIMYINKLKTSNLDDDEKKSVAQIEAILNKTIQPNKNYIFIYSLFNNIFNYKNINEIFEESNSTRNFNKLLQQVFQKLFDLIKTLPSLYSSFQSKLQDSEYIKLFDNDKVLTYIRLRNDTIDTEFPINPRYTLQIVDNKLYMKYINIDGSLGKEQEYHNKLKELEPTNSEYYYFGPFDGVFQEKNTAEINTRSELNKIVNKIVNGEPICVIGYGQSGSGKTSALIYNKFSNETGILVKLCAKPQIIEKYGNQKAKLQMYDIYVNFNEDNIQFVGKKANLNNTAFEMKHYRKKIINIDDTSNFEFEYNPKNENWEYLVDKKNANIPEDKRRNIGTFIDEGFKQREVDPTPNNQDSSRSHVIVCLTFNDGTKDVKVIVCDLAGVENVFECMDPKTIEKFDEKYAKGSEKYTAYDKQGNVTEPLQYINFGRDYLLEQKDEQNSKTPKLQGFFNDYVKEKLKEYNDSKYKADYDSKLAKQYPIVLTKAEKAKKQSQSGGGINDFLEGAKIPEYCNSELGLTITDKKIIEMLNEIGDGDIKLLETKIKEYMNTISTAGIDKIINKHKFIKDVLGIVSVKPPLIANQSAKIRLEMFMDEKIKAFNNLKENTALVGNKLLEPINKLTEKYYQTTYDTSDEFFKDILTFLIDQNYVISNQKLINKNALYSGTNELNAVVWTDYLNYLFQIKYGTTTRDANEKHQSSELVKLAQNKINELEQSKGSILEQQYKAICSDVRFHALLFNCRLRVMEGQMINNSLADLRERIKIEVLKSIGLNKDTQDKDGQLFLPIMYHKPYISYKTNTFTDLDPYEKFIVDEKKGTIPDPKSIVLDIINKEFGVTDLSTLSFVVFTVVNLTNNGFTNNPPNPPFINVNNLNYNNEMLVLYDKIKNFTQKKIVEANIEKENLILKKKIENYTFYKDYLKQDIKKVVDIINSTNPATLIGSLISTEVIRYPFTNALINSYLSGEKKENELLKLLNKINNNITTNGSNIGFQDFEVVNSKLTDIFNSLPKYKLDSIAEFVQSGGFRNFLKYKLSKYY